MDVTFTRTGYRRYSVTAVRELGPPVVIGVAPGYDAFLPHDLMHFAVEAGCAIEYGIFGRLGAGGVADGWATRRVRRKAAWRSERLRELGPTDVSVSERLAGEAQRALEDRRAGRPVEASPEVARLLPRLDELAAQWQALGVGESMTLAWPLPERRVTRGAKAGKGGVRRRAAVRS